MIGDDEDYVINKEANLTYMERLKMIAASAKKLMGNLSELPEDEEDELYFD